MRQEAFSQMLSQCLRERMLLSQVNRTTGASIM
jgi:hypothetical protein